jgi:hypothetical protein
MTCRNEGTDDTPHESNNHHLLFNYLVEKVIIESEILAGYGGFLRIYYQEGATE